MVMANSFTDLVSHYFMFSYLSSHLFTRISKYVTFSDFFALLSDFRLFETQKITVLLLKPFMFHNENRPCFKNFSVFTPQDFNCVIGHFLILYMESLKCFREGMLSGQYIDAYRTGYGNIGPEVCLEPILGKSSVLDI